MKVVKVIPISRGIKKDSLSYFSKSDIPSGHLVDINIRGKKKKGLVVESIDVSKEKANLKTEKFSLKKLEKDAGILLVTEKFSKAIENASKYFASHMGALLYETIPQSLFKAKIPKRDFKIRNSFHEKVLLQAPVEERISQYKSAIRENLALNRSVFILSPTNYEAEKNFNLLAKGINNFAYLLHTNLTQKKQKETIEEVLENDRPIALFMTPQFLSIPRKDLGLILVDKEFSEFYKKKTRPFIDYRKFAEILAEEAKIKILFGDTYLRTETLWRESNGEFETLLPLKARLARDIEINILDMAKEKEFSIFNKKVLKEIASNKKSFIFIGRRGLHPLTLCNDCGKTVKCDRCDSPAVLHKSGGNTFFLCHKCGKGREAEDKCSYCDSWKLTTLGIGSALIEKELKKHFKKTKIFRFDSDSVKTPKKALKLMDDFYKEKQAILVGTQKSLTYLEKTDLSVIVSLDSLFSLPDYKISEKAFSLLLDIRFKTLNKIILQTRNSHDKSLTFFKEGSLLDFYRKEIKDREEFKLPPFSKLIKFVYSGTKPKVLKISKELEKEFKDFNIFTYPSFVKKIKGKHFYNALIKLDRKTWVDENLLKKILKLSPEIAVDVDPDSIL